MKAHYILFDPGDGDNGGQSTDTIMTFIPDPPDGETGGISTEEKLPKL
jgi:hypothetical protein